MCYSGPLQCRGISVSSSPTTVINTMELIHARRAVDRHPSPLLGGIDADVMGLGKTLTMLSAMVCSLRAARDFATYIQEKMEVLPTRATLVVATSPRTSWLLIRGPDTD